MRYLALASDYDGTLAHDGIVAPETLARMESLLATGRKLILVTGRELEDLLKIFTEVKLFHRIVAENGAVLYDPATGQDTLLATPVPDAFTQELRKRAINFSVGQAIVATWQPYASEVLAAIHELGLELQTIFNRDAVMILPAGVNKATGLTAALEALDLSAHDVIGVGDAENDHAFLALCEFSVAVSNALPALKEHADWVTAGEDGAGVSELIAELIATDLESRDTTISRHRMLLGKRSDDSEVWVTPRSPNILIGGPSGSGKSTAATSLIERLADEGYQFCIIDPEGDYEGLPGTVTLGRGGHGPTAEEVLEVIAKPQHNVVVNLLGLPVTDRPAFFLELLPRLQDMRARTGRPHWIIVDEAHHVLPLSWEPNQTTFVGELQRTVFITVHPDQILPAALRSIGIVLAVGKEPWHTLDLFCKPLGLTPPKFESSAAEADMALLWPLASGEKPYAIRIAPSHIEHQRHIRKYAIGELPPERSFYFRGPEEKLNLRAQNLQIFLQLADGVDIETWLYHLRNSDYSHWFRECIKDDQLASNSETIEKQDDISAEESRKKIRELIEAQYVPAVAPPLPIPGTDAAPIRQG